ncbi:MAG TPA: NGG1p interacting factor NIF3 [Cellvibrionaceae bacterium]
MNKQLEEGRDYRVKLSFYVPIDFVEAVKAAVFAAGAGSCGNYQFCAWQTLGQGQFIPLPGSQPHIGQVGELTYVQEYKVELLCSGHSAAAVEAALLQAHPYEAPAYEFTRIWLPS